jgi:hypothetical protein
MGTFAGTSWTTVLLSLFLGSGTAAVFIRWALPRLLRAEIDERIELKLSAALEPLREELKAVATIHLDLARLGIELRAINENVKGQRVTMELAVNKLDAVVNAAVEALSGLSTRVAVVEDRQRQRRGD